MIWAPYSLLPSKKYEKGEREVVFSKVVWICDSERGLSTFEYDTIVTLLILCTDGLQWLFLFALRLLTLELTQKTVTRAMLSELHRLRYAGEIYICDANATMSMRLGSLVNR